MKSNAVIERVTCRTINCCSPPAANSRRKSKVARKFVYESLFFMAWFWTWESGSHFLTKYNLWPWTDRPTSAAQLQAEAIEPATPTTPPSTVIAGISRSTR
jgi:hypothetical protein